MAKSAAETALAAIDQQINEAENIVNGLQRARVLLVTAMGDEDDPVNAPTPKKRGRGKAKAKPGLPAQAESDTTF